VPGGARRSRELSVGLTLLAAVLCVASSALLVRWCASEALAVAFWRLALAAAVLWGAALPSPRARRETLRAFATPWAAGAGLFLAAHFALWIRSLDLTTVAASCFLLAVQVPVAGLVSWLLLREPPGGRALLGMALTLAGVTLLSAGAFRAEGGLAGSALGNLLAVGGGITYVGYVGIGRRVRERVPIFRYLAAVYLWAAIGVGCAAAALGRSLAPARPEDWLPLALLALVPTLGGHGLFNQVLARVRVYVVNLAVMGEFVAASVLAWLVLGETPGRAFWPAAPLILAGAALAVRETVRMPPPRAPALSRPSSDRGPAAGRPPDRSPGA
jgi:drug/metabolite transporter (DMT)-like permease